MSNVTDPLQDLVDAVRDGDHPYHLLAVELLGAFSQAAHGKGKERHAWVDGPGNLPFTQQPIFRISGMLGSQAGPGGLLFQAMKKTQESLKLSVEHAKAERRGAMVYLCAANIFEDRDR